MNIVEKVTQYGILCGKCEVALSYGYSSSEVECFAAMENLKKEIDVDLEYLLEYRAVYLGLSK